MSSQHQPSSSRLQVHVKDGYASIDFGSTSTRAFTYTINKKTRETNGYRVQKTGVDDDKKRRFLRGEWPSKGLPFDAPYLVGYDAAGREHADKRDRSLKSFVWLLANDDDEHPYTKDLKDYYDSLPELQEKQKFRKRLTSMLVKHLAIVADQIHREAVLRQTTIRRLVFCVPNAWDKPNFQNVLKPIMDKVACGIGCGDDTYCVFESEALSQFILHQHPYLLTGWDFVLVCDFGGHFMGGSLFQFCRDGADDDQPAFFSLPQGNFGVRGGSQLWEDHIRPYIDAHLATLGLPADRASVLRAKFLDAFFLNKNEVDASFYAKGISMRLVGSITDAFPDDTKLYPLYLQPAEILQAWQLGFRASVDLALDKIRMLPSYFRGRTVVILSGGSMQNYHARTEIQQACKKYGLECQAVGFDVNVESSKWMVCEGAAMSEARAMKPKDFFRRGAAIAVQSYKKGVDFNTGAEVLFYGGQQPTSYSANSHSPGQLEHFEYISGNPVEIKLGGHEHNKIRLVCDPMYQRHCYQYPKGYITIESSETAANYNSCYDIWDVSRRFEEMHTNDSNLGTRIPAGTYFMQAKSIEYHEDGGGATLHLHLTRRSVKRPSPATASKNLRARAETTGYDDYTFDLPLTSCGPSNLVLLDIDKVKDRLWKPLQARTKLPQSVPERESAHEYSPVAKRQRTAVSLAQEPHNAGWHVVDRELPAKPQQQESEGVAADSPEALSPERSFHTAAKPLPAAETRHEASGIHCHGGDSDLGDRISTSSTASLRGLKRNMGPAVRPLKEAHARIPDMGKVLDLTESDSESSASIETIINSAGFSARI